MLRSHLFLLALWKAHFLWSHQTLYFTLGGADIFLELDWWYEVVGSIGYSRLLLVNVDMGMKCEGIRSRGFYTKPF